MRVCPCTRSGSGCLSCTLADVTTTAGLSWFDASRGTRLSRVLGRAGRTDDDGIRDGPGVDLEASGLQFLSYLDK